MTTAVDDDLPRWDTLDGPWEALLIGNGLSINLWSDFAYSTLFDKTKLSKEASTIFVEIDTTNFEAVLECIYHARVVLDALESQTKSIDAVYEEVRDALFEAVANAHLPWSQFPAGTAEKVAKTISEYGRVYTTNYDLCIYWAHQRNRTSVNIVDFFWEVPGNTFNPRDVDIHPNRTPVYYLHGAIHLWQDEEGTNGKWTNTESGPLLDLASKYDVTSGIRPLFVSEGTSKAKLRTIQRSPYLTFCLESLTRDTRNLAIFGHSLSKQDEHIVNAINSGPKRRIAVAIYPKQDPVRIIEEKARIQQVLDRQEIYFFDSTTHPLGESALRIKT